MTTRIDTTTGSADPADVYDAAIDYLDDVDAEEHLDRAIAAGADHGTGEFIAELSRCGYSDEEIAMVLSTLRTGLTAGDVSIATDALMYTLLFKLVAEIKYRLTAVEGRVLRLEEANSSKVAWWKWVVSGAALVFTTWLLMVTHFQNSSVRIQSASMKLDVSAGTTSFFVDLLLGLVAAGVVFFGLTFVKDGASRESTGRTPRRPSGGRTSRFRRVTRIRRTS